MFDERSEKWIRIYKGFAIAFFWIYVVAGLFAFIENQWIGDIFDIYIGGYFLGSVLLLFAGFAIGYAQLAANMLIIQLLNNVQTIRETLSKQGNNQNDNTKLEELKKFKKLLDMNVITAEEYEAKKAQLLEQI